MAKLPVEDAAVEVYDLEWKRSTFEEVFNRVHSLYCSKGKEEEYQLLLKNLKGRHSDETVVDFDFIAVRLGTNANNVKAKMFQFRKNLNKYLREVVEETVPADQVDSEIASMMNLTAR